MTDIDKLIELTDELKEINASSIFDFKILVLSLFIFWFGITLMSVFYEGDVSTVLLGQLSCIKDVFNAIVNSIINIKW